MTDQEWEHIKNRVFPAKSPKAPVYLWTRVLSQIESEENKWSSVWWSQWRWMLKITFAISLLAMASSYYWLDNSAVPLETALEGVSTQHRAITLAQNPDQPEADSTDFLVGVDS